MTSSGSHITDCGADTVARATDPNTAFATSPWTLSGGYDGAHGTQDYVGSPHSPEQTEILNIAPGCRGVNLRM
jgi:hypothetical protein